MNNLSHLQSKKESGFTLIELLIVVAILGLLAAIGIPQYQGYQAQAKINATKGLYTSTVKLVGAELAKCTAGATNYLEASGTNACSDAVSAMVTAFITYGNANNDNPYGGTDPMVATTADANGEVSLVVSGTTGITIATYYNDAVQESTTLIKE